MNARLSPGGLQQTASTDADLDALARAAFDLAAGEMRGRDLCGWLDAGEYPRLRALAESAREHTEALHGAFRFIDRPISACWCRVSARRLPSGASLAWLHLRASAGGIRLTISDNGVGMADPAETQRGMGLRIMAYRARMVGGNLSIENRRGGGLQIRLTCPQTPQAALRADSA